MTEQPPLTGKDTYWLKQADVPEGVRWEKAPARFAKLERLGLVSTQARTFAAGSERAIITGAGRAVLAALDGS